MPLSAIRASILGVKSASKELPRPRVPALAGRVEPPATAARVSRPSSPPSYLRELTGWGANHRAACDLREPETERAVRLAIDSRGAIARGVGRSYGDQAVNDWGRVIGMSRLDRYLSFDEASGSLTCEAGVTLAQIIADFAPRGFFPFITPGTKYVTVGGCIANDVHGKAHHVQGCFSSAVESMRVLLATGQVVTASREERPDLFWGMCGGLGLLGVVLTATIRLRRIETTYFKTRSVRAQDLDAMLAALEEYDTQFPYSVATLNPTATGRNLGGGVLMLGDHAAASDLPPSLAQHPLKVSGDPRLSVPFELPEVTLNRWTVPLLNLLIQEKIARGGDIAHYEGFFYPLDFVGQWNRAYGRRGFTQYQFVIPFDQGAARMRELLETIVASGELPFLNVLKRLGKESGGVLSFPREGYTFAIDFPVRKNTAALVRRLDAMVCDAGGRIYLGKDAYVQPDMLRAMYPDAVERFLALKAKYDPAGVFTSDLARRVGLA